MVTPEQREAALTWAGAFALSLPELSRSQIQAVWEGAEAAPHRAVLKAVVADAYQQLVTHIRIQLSNLPQEQAA